MLPDAMTSGENARAALKIGMHTQRRVIAIANEKVSMANNLYQAIDKQVRLDSAEISGIPPRILLIFIV